MGKRVGLLVLAAAAAASPSRDVGPRPTPPPSTVRFEIRVESTAALPGGGGLTYIARQELVDNDPSALERFLKATMRGIQDAKDSPEAATEFVQLRQRLQARPAEPERGQRGFQSS